MRQELAWIATACVRASALSQHGLERERRHRRLLPRSFSCCSAKAG
jgi:hypothetical protein